MPCGPWQSRQKLRHRCACFRCEVQREANVTVAGQKGPVPTGHVRFQGHESSSPVSPANVGSDLAACALLCYVQERINVLECSQQELAEQHGLVTAELQAAQESVMAAEADKAELQGALECCTRQLTEAAAVADKLRQQLQAQEQEQHEAVGQLREQVEEAQVNRHACLLLWHVVA